MQITSWPLTEQLWYWAECKAWVVRRKEIRNEKAFFQLVLGPKKGFKEKAGLMGMCVFKHVCLGKSQHNGRD